jgi:hypothetical protein
MSTDNNLKDIGLCDKISIEKDRKYCKQLLDFNQFGYLQQKIDCSSFKEDVESTRYLCEMRNMMFEMIQKSNRHTIKCD